MSTTSFPALFDTAFETFERAFDALVETRDEALSSVSFEENADE